MRVVPRVISYGIAVVHLLPDDARVGRDRATDHEKRRVDVLLAQHLENAVGVRRIRAVIVG